MKSGIEIKSFAAFTLVELLVVVAVITLLAALLLPSLRLAQETARSISCASQMREVGQAFYMFANDYNGRFPDAGNGTGIAIRWQKIINALVFKRDRVVRFPYSGIRSKWELYCPSIQRWPDLDPAAPWYRAWTANIYVLGSIPAWSPYTCYAPPKSEWPEEFLACDTYFLGAPVSIFKRPSYAYLLLESDTPNDVVYSSGASGCPDFATNAYSSPSWSANNGFYSFRHKNHMAANFLFVDGHAESMLRTNNTINLSERYNP